MSLFQFHNGTINTICRHGNKFPKFCFNSTTVQLIQTEHQFYTQNEKSFNSTTVQLILKALGS